MCDIHALSVLKHSAIDFAMCNIRECIQKKSHFHANFPHCEAFPRMDRLHAINLYTLNTDTTTVSTKDVFSPSLVRTLLIGTDESILVKSPMLVPMVIAQIAFLKAPPSSVIREYTQVKGRSDVLMMAALRASPNSLCSLPIKGFILASSPIAAHFLTAINNTSAFQPSIGIN